jgi:hypothetical protein
MAPSAHLILARGIKLKSPNSARMHQPTRFQVIEFVKGLFVPFESMNQIVAKMYAQNQNVLAASSYAMCYAGGIAGCTRD